MNKTFIFLIVLLTNCVYAQFVGTPYIIPIDSRPVLDQVGVSPSFAFSTRKLREVYTGFAIRIRRSSDNAQADVAFDSNNVVSDASIVTIAVAGGGLIVGNMLSLSSFRSGSTLYVATWYDQGTNGYDAIQTTTTRQPAFNVASVGPGNVYASLVFTGTSQTNVTVNKTLPTLLGGSLRGSVMMLAKVINGSTTSNNSWGYSDIANNAQRWGTHMNWPDGYMYTDLGNANDVSRAFANSTAIGLNAFKQYSLIRAQNSKIVRVSGVDRNNTTQSYTTITWSANSTFGIGLMLGALDVTYNQHGFTGNIPEFILFPEPLTTAQYQQVEANQISFWGAN